MDPRLIAFNLIEEWQTKQTFPNLALKNALRTVKDARDRRFITTLVYGVVERKITLDHFLSQCSDRKLDRLSPTVLAVLRLGLYQLFYMQVPASAACNTSVELIKKQKAAHSAGFVNAVLRRCDCERETLLALKKADFSVRYSISVELVDILLDQYGKEQFVAIMEGMNEPGTAVHLFHNIKRGDESEFLAKMKSEGILLSKTELPHLYRSDCGFSIEDSVCYRDGWYHVVGKHSAEAALLMHRSAKRIMDLCAAPGGKTFIMASLCEGEILASDIHPHKVELLQKSAKRLGHQNVIAHVLNAADFHEEFKETADFVLCDVPCSGLGIMGKKPDIKYKSYISTEFTDLQMAILQNGAEYLKPGGRLVYSTCTIDRRENDLNIERFLSKNKNFTVDCSVYPEGYKVYLPHHGEDGFFISVLRKADI